MKKPILNNKAGSQALLQTSTRRLKTRVLIIGGGATGTGIARDLALRGVHCILAEKNDINAGASGSNHGLLHSGARYVASDKEAAMECREEGILLKRLAAHCIDDTGGLFVAVEGDDESYVSDFSYMCAKSGIPAKPLELERAKELEPAVSDRLIAAYEVEDASIDPFRLSLENISHAQALGGILLRYSNVVEFKLKNKRIQWTKIVNSNTGEETIVEADMVVNASGAWAKNTAMLAGIQLDMIYSKGSLLVTQTRIARRVINRLRPPTDSDILVPGGTVSILGTTSVRTDTLDKVHPTVEEIDQIVAEGSVMAPILGTTRYIRAYSGVRPLIGSQSKSDDRKVSRGFALIDHEHDDVNNFITISGGKLSTFRLMAEKASNLVCRHLSISTPCKTRTVPLPDSISGQWTEPGLAPRVWLKQAESRDDHLCECEMVPKSVIDSIVKSIKEHNQRLSLEAIGLRSRLGKGPCQGTYCSVRAAGHLYDTMALNGDEGLAQLKEFLNERWRGQRPLLWDLPLIQSELMEAIHCGLFGLELELDYYKKGGSGE